MKSDDTDRNNGGNTASPSKKSSALELQDARMVALQGALALCDNSNQCSRTRWQMRMHNIWGRACFGPDSGEISKVAVQAPQQVGKTFAMSMFLAAYMWTQGGCTIAGLSLSLRSAAYLIDRTRRMLPLVTPKDTTSTVVYGNMYRLCIRASNGKWSTLKVYPASPRSLDMLPTTPDLLILDDPDLFSDAFMHQLAHGRFDDARDKAVLSIQRLADPESNSAWSEISARYGFLVKDYEVRYNSFGEILDYTRRV